ncbi:MAG TPA: NCS2 family permease [Acidimicrobiia bacterium]|nr:NCS2 family permease [Acidimicrobiia bacterium]
MTDTAQRSGASSLDSYFHITERGSSVGTEVRAGVTTFLVMAYIIFVNADILSVTGLDPGAVAAATALAAGVLSIAMGLYSNYPIALAAGLGINGAVAFGLVLGNGLSPAGAMGVIVLEGLVVLVLVMVGLREAIMEAVPMALKRAIGVGIGLFILFIGFVNGGLIQQPAGDGPVPVEFIFPNSAGASLTLIGLLITVILYVSKVKGALILSILATAVIGLLMGVQSMPDTFSVVPSFATLGEFDLGEVFTALGWLAALLTIFSFMLTDFFDTMGTATAVVEQAGLTDEEGRIPRVGPLLLVDSAGAAIGGMAGVSSNTSYIESAAGVAEGGRTGLTSVTVGVLFLISIFLSPLAGLIPSQATAPVLILVGFLMCTLIKDIDFENFEEGFPALLAIILMPLTYSITVGIGAGFVMYVVVKAVRGKFSEIHPLMWVVAAAFAIYFAQNLLGSAISA